MGVNRSLLFGERHLLECSGPQRSVSRFSLGDAAPLRQALVVRAALEKQPRPSWSRAAGGCRGAGLCPRDSASTWQQQQQQQRLWLGFPQSACKSHVFGGRVKLPLWDFCMGCWARGDSSLTAARMSKVCAIFGGSRGIGVAVAQLLAQRGYFLAIIARNLDLAQTTAKSLGGGHLAFSCDVSKEDNIQTTFKEIEKSLGPVNYLVNAAGVNRDGLLLRTKTDDMISQLHTNLLGTMLTCRAAVKSMIHHQGGAIVNIGSIVGLKGNSGQSIYSASKAGLVGFSRSLAKEVAKKNIRVNVVAPGFIHTDMTAHLKEEQLKKTIPLGRFGEPQEVATAIAFLLETPYVTGHVLVVDGGLQLMI